MEGMGSKRICIHLPADIVEEILLQLPIKSVLRFKCLSKLWRSSIRSKVFIREHLNKSNSSTDFTHYNLIFTYNQILPRRHIFELFCIGSLHNHDDYKPIPSIGSNLSSIPMDNNWFYLLGSCNGLVLIIIKWRGLYLWNPSTRKEKRILTPHETISSKRVWWDSCSRYVFGYDESTDDYKVVCVLSSSSDSFRAEIHMYSWRTGSWKKSRNVDKGSLPDPYHSAKFVNGRLHWLKWFEKDDEQTGWNDENGWYIVSLDLVGEDKYQIMVPPELIQGGYVLEDFGGYLSLICYKYSKRSRNVCETMNIWVMKNEDWSNILTLSFDHFGPRPKPLCLKKNGDIVVAFGSDVIIYRGNDKLCQSSVDMFYDRIESVVCVESLVSPFGDHDEQQGQ